MAFNHVSLVTFVLLSLSTIAWPQEYPAELIYQAAKGNWLENLETRRDGSILTTLLTSPDIFLIQPSPANPDPQLIQHFDGYTSTLGIAQQGGPDTYQVLATNFSFKTISTTPKSSALFRVKVESVPGSVPKSEARLTARLPDVNFPNGLATLNDRIVLLADSVKGTVVSVDTRSGANAVVIDDPVLKPGAGFFAGVNGLKVHHNHAYSGGNKSAALYFTNGGQGIFGRFEIHRQTGRALGPATIISHALSTYPNEPPSARYDDFALDTKGKKAYLATSGGNVITEVDIATGRQIIIAGNLNSTEIAEPSAALFGKGDQSRTLFVTTAGGLASPVNGNEVVGGQLVAIDIRR